MDLPQVAVIGQQSAGKSSVIEAISGITLPRSSGTCTRCALGFRPPLHLLMSIYVAARLNVVFRAHRRLGNALSHSDLTTKVKYGTRSLGPLFMIKAKWKTESDEPREQF